VGNVFKLAGWSIGFAHVAAGRSKVFLFLQLVFCFIFISVIWLSLTPFGIVAAGPAFLIAYIVGLIVNITLVRHFLDFRWQGLSLGLLILHVGLSIMLLALALVVPLAAALASPVLAGATGLFGLRIVLVKIGREGRLASRFARFYKAIGWPIREAL